MLCHISWQGWAGRKTRGSFIQMSIFGKLQPEGNFLACLIIFAYYLCRTIVLKKIECLICTLFEEKTFIDFRAFYQII